MLNLDFPGSSTPSKNFKADAEFYEKYDLWIQPEDVEHIRTLRWQKK